RKERPKVKLITGAKSYQGSRTGSCGWNTSCLDRSRRRDASSMTAPECLLIHSCSYIMVIKN
ncbi:MAG: hypothetical protein J6T22_16310, partial [Bacteroidales bacterium]|nr:hypothetical protein [Bacteroidales bacterium]